MKSVIEGNPTLEALRAATVISNMNNSLQDNFVMVFDDIITVSSRMDQNVNVEAELRRLACKFEINANVQETIEVEDDGVNSCGRQDQTQTEIESAAQETETEAPALSEEELEESYNEDIVLIQDR